MYIRFYVSHFDSRLDHRLYTLRQQNRAFSLRQYFSARKKKSSDIAWDLNLWYNWLWMWNSQPKLTQFLMLPLGFRPRYAFAFGGKNCGRHKAYAAPPSLSFFMLQCITFKERLCDLLNSILLHPSACFTPCGFSCLNIAINENDLQILAGDAMRKNKKSYSMLTMGAIFWEIHF